MRGDNLLLIDVIPPPVERSLRCNCFIGSNDRNIMLHHHFPEVGSPFHNGLVSGQAKAMIIERHTYRSPALSRRGLGQREQ